MSWCGGVTKDDDEVGASKMKGRRHDQDEGGTGVGGGPLAGSRWQ